MNTPSWARRPRQTQKARPKKPRKLCVELIPTVGEWPQVDCSSQVLQGWSTHTLPIIALGPGAVLDSASIKDFGRIQWNRSQPIEAGAQKIASGFGAAEIKAIFDGFWRFSAPTPLHSAILARLEAALAVAASPPDLCAVKTINRSRWRGLEREPDRETARADGGDRFFFQMIGSNRYAGPNRSLPTHPINAYDTGGMCRDGTVRFNCYRTVR